ncbi:phosphoribosylformylglycinamidine cyclo-ligase [Hydrogenivirga sp. 128-5-R1-1]|uniref:phosphoribosylformylglycinamidine cyclo-ligase n=1 Tax=Hydrogenivirga sp. 128-5-R1-1 TaxID=392423 RepID=UPI00015F0D29|nr:phosphoribosylformylglycinamidine cyclo-ligase [Hydrogenivirga sp. 128-5-R1-1]EDP75947.1 phosphoribosylaminoimidazole synthetase [Hydrogenivirga sp. 128-5-R1-1]
MTTYRDAGVDIDRANEFVAYIKEKVKRAFPDSPLTKFGGFASGLPVEGHREPVIFSSTDGVGTKLKVAQELGVHDTVGIDLVAMNVNDVITTGADPLLFLDYIATGRIDLQVLKAVIDGVVEGCKRGEVLLAGGETAEMPGFYPEGVYDLAGFCVGVCERGEVITGEGVRSGDVLLGLRSSGFHSNGFSLIRKVLKDKGVKLTDRVEELGQSVGEVLLTPTRIYTPEVKLLKSNVELKALAHITGGGIPENLIRVLPEGIRAVVDKKSIPENPVFAWIQKLGGVEEREMFRTFNMGVGMIAVVSPEDCDKALDALGRDAFVCGHLEEGKREVVIL